MLGVSHLAGFGAGASGCGCVPATWDGDRQAGISVASNITWDAGTTIKLFDGLLGDAGTQAVDTPASFANGDYIEVTFAAPILLNEITAKALGAFDFGDWCVKLGGQTSNTFSLDGTTSITRTVTGLTIGGTVLRFEKVGTEAPTNTWWREIEGKLCTC